MERWKYGLLAAIILIALFLRVLPAFNGTFNEPDNYYYFSILTQVHGFALPQISIFDGIKPAEMPGLYFPAIVFMLFGANPIVSMYLSTELAVMLIIILTFIFTRYVFNNDTIAFLAIGFLAISLASMSRTMITEFRGDTFFPIFLLAAFIMFVEFEKRRDYKYVYFSAVFIIMAILSWTGGVIALGILVMGTVLYLGFALQKTYKFYSVLVLSLSPIILVGLWYSLASYGGYGINAISELQQPTASYVIANYGITGIFSPAIFLMLNPLIGPAEISIIIFMVCFASFLFMKKLNMAKAMLMSMAIIFLTMNVFYTRFDALASIPVAIISAYLLFMIANSLKSSKVMLYFYSFTLSLIFILGLIVAYHNMATLQPANSDNVSMMSAMAYLTLHTPQNSTILSFWPDGSVIEAYQRKAIDDSVAGQFRGSGVSKWLLADNLSLSQYPQANYILSRGIYLNELIGICYFADDSNLMNCTREIDTNGTLKSQYLGQFQKTNLFRLLNSCNAINCTIAANGIKLKLDYINGSNKIYEVVK